jgi:hypothetical protein
MLQTTYLTIDTLKSYTPISANVDVSQLENWIPVAEDLHIDDILGTALDTALKSELEATGTLTGNNATLLTYILNASAWYTYYECIGFIRTKSMNKGLVQQFSDNSQVTPLEDYKIFKQEIWDKAIYYRNKLIDYLEANKALFPLYRSCNSDFGDCDSGDCASKDNSTGIWF